MTQQITGELFKRMVANATAAIENNKQEVNDLNVFPVPDGDTGTNMRLTIGAAETALAAASPETLGRAADITASAMLRGARGNSGVILSLLFRGFAKRLKDVEAANAATFADALATGVDSAYKAVMKPVEGTILTVSRHVARGAALAAEMESDVEIVLEQALAAGYIALADTINQNPVLKKAEVIDAGGKGYLYMLDGMLKALRGVVIVKATQDVQPAGKADFTKFDEGDIKFAYCTEFIVERKNKTDTNKLRAFLDARGDSIVVVDDNQIVKVHVHTNDPGVVLTEALSYGSLHSIKIDNMHEQHSETVNGAGSGKKAEQAVPSTPPEPPKAPEPSKPPAPEEMKAFGIVVVCTGTGIEEVFRDLGADRTITGGQTMNPSTEDILEKVNATPSDTVFVLPNNKNIIMAAQQCVPLTSKNVIVIPTTSIPQGVSAMLAFDDSGSADDIAADMTDAAGRVRTALVTLAVHDSIFDGREIMEGDCLALLEDSIAASGSDTSVVIDELAVMLSDFVPEYITIYAGQDVSEDEATSVAECIGVASPDAEITIIRGEQPLYHYIISAE